MKMPLISLLTVCLPHKRVKPMKAGTLFSVRQIAQNETTSKILSIEHLPSQSQCCWWEGEEAEQGRRGHTCSFSRRCADVAALALDAIAVGLHHMPSSTRV